MYDGCCSSQASVCGNFLVRSGSTVVVEGRPAFFRIDCDYVSIEAFGRCRTKSRIFYPGFKRSGSGFQAPASTMEVTLDEVMEKSFHEDVQYLEMLTSFRKHDTPSALLRGC